jgi:hypothetical protein
MPNIAFTDNILFGGARLYVRVPPAYSVDGDAAFQRH